MPFGKPSHTVPKSAWIPLVGPRLVIQLFTSGSCPVTLVRHTESDGVMLQLGAPMSGTNGAHDVVTRPRTRAAPTTGDDRLRRRARRARRARASSRDVDVGMRSSPGATGGRFREHCSP